MTSKLSQAQAAKLFETCAYAATLPEKFRRGFELGPRYYMRDVPRYWIQRKRLGLPMLDLGALRSPLRSALARAYSPGSPPPHLDEAYARLYDAGVRFDNSALRVEALATRWWEARAAPGDVIECGAFRGATSLLIAVLGHLNATPQKVLMLDTFNGTPPPSNFDSAREQGEYAPPAGWPELLQEQAETLGVAERVEVHVGLFAESFQNLASESRCFSFAHIDANIYEGTLEACEFTLPRMSRGACVVFDDYNGLCDLGARLAIDQALAPHGRNPKPLAECSAYLRF